MFIKESSPSLTIRLPFFTFLHSTHHFLTLHYISAYLCIVCLPHYPLMSLFSFKFIFVFYMIAILVGMKWYFIVVLICMMTNDVKHLIMCLLDICKYSLLIFQLGYLFYYYWVVTVLGFLSNCSIHYWIILKFPNIIEHLFLFSVLSVFVSGILEFFY